MTRKKANRNVKCIQIGRDEFRQSAQRPQLARRTYLEHLVQWNQSFPPEMCPIKRTVADSTDMGKTENAKGILLYCII